MSRLGASALALAAPALIVALALGAPAAWAHGDPEITVRPAAVDAGGTITIEGEGFEARSEIALSLAAASGEADLGAVTADDEGAFRYEAAVPRELSGSVEARAQSGDDRAVARFNLSGAAEGETAGTVATQMTFTGEQEEDGHVLLTATLTDAQGQPVAAAPVEFFIAAELLDVTGQVPVAEATTDANGVAGAEYTPTFDGEIQATARFDGVGFYAASESGATFEVTEFEPAYAVEKAGLDVLRRFAPLGVALVVLAVWSTFGFVAYQIYRIARAGGEA